MNRALGTLAAVTLLSVTAVGSPALAAANDRPQVLLRIQDDQITEASGMTQGQRNPEILWVVEDSGNPPVVYGIDRQGATVAVLRVAGATNVDWEAMAPTTGADGRPALLIGDIGDNGAVRTSISLYEVPEPATVADQVVPAQHFELRYPDGAHDAEALMVDPTTGTAYVVTKGAIGAGVYRVPQLVQGRTVTLERVGDAPSFVTDAAFEPNGRGLVLRTYSSAYFAPSVSQPPTARIGLPLQPQGETIAWSVDGRSLLIGSEGLRSAVYRLPVAASWLTASPSAAPSPPATEQGSDVPTAAVAAVVGLAVLVGVVAVVLVSRAGRRRGRSPE